MPEIIVKLGDHEVQRLILDKDRIAIGRAGDNDVAIENLSISRHHAEILRQDDNYYLVDLDSANGTYVNGVRVARTQIYHQDIISLGKHKLHFLAPEAAISPASAAEFERTMVMDKSSWVGCLTVEIAKQRKGAHSLSQPVTRVGRAPDNDVRLLDWFVEPYQFEILREKGRYRLRDVAGRESTRLNGAAVSEKELRENDAIEVGNARMTFSLLEVGATPAPFLRVPQEIEAAELESIAAAKPGEPEHAFPFYSEATPTEGFRVEPEPVAAPSAEAEEAFPFEIEMEEPEPLEAQPLEAMPIAEAPAEAGVELAEEPAGPHEIPSAEEVESAPEAAFEQVAEEAPVGAAETPSPYEGPASALEEIEDELADVRLSPDFETAPESEALERFEPMAVPETAPEERPWAAGATPEPALEEGPEPTPLAPEAEPVAPAEPAAAEPVGDAAARAVAVLEKALENPSRAVRKQAALRLKKLTGRDYDY